MKKGANGVADMGVLVNAWFIQPKDIGKELAMVKRETIR